MRSLLSGQQHSLTTPNQMLLLLRNRPLQEENEYQRLNSGLGARAHKTEKEGVGLEKMGGGD